MIKKSPGRPVQNEVLVIDIGGSHVKCFCGSAQDLQRFVSGAHLTPAQMVDGVRGVIGRRRFSRVSIGYPGAVKKGRPAREPVNLGQGWVDFDFDAAFGAPVRLINDAAMQALGSYRSGTMLFLGFGTGLGTAAVVEGAVLPLELGHLPYKKGHSYEHYVGALALKRQGVRKWRSRVIDVIEVLRAAFVPDDLALGGGNAFRIIKHVENARLVEELSAFTGGVRLWSAPAEASAGTKPSPRAPAFHARSRTGR